MNLQEILAYPLLYKNVLIIGCPASGKTYLSKLLDRGDHVLIHTDDYLPFGFVGSLSACIDAANNVIGKTIVEGVQGYRMLRKGFENGNYMPDIVIECEVSTQRMNMTYVLERDPAKIQYLRDFKKGHVKILNEYFAMCPKEKQPIWLTFENNY